MNDQLERLHILKRQLDELDGRRRVYMEERGRVVGELIEAYGYKKVALALGVSKSRLYRIREQAKTREN